MDDKLIVNAFLQKRTEESFFALFQVFCARVRRFFVLHGLDLQTAEDLSQEVFLKVFRKAGELRDPDHFAGWLFAIARNVFISHWRQQKARIREYPQESSGGGNSIAVEATAVPTLCLTEWLEPLEADERNLVILRFVEGLSYKELADALAIPIGTVKWRISEVRRKLLSIMCPSRNGSERQEFQKSAVH